MKKKSTAISILLRVFIIINHSGISNAGESGVRLESISQPPSVITSVCSN